MVLRAYSWPGNVRELENTIQQAVLLNGGEAISLGDLPQHIVASSAGEGGGDFYNVPLREARERFERRYLKEVLERAGGNVAEAAQKAGINRQYFYEKMKRYGVER